MVLLGNMCVNTLHERDNDDNNNMRWWLLSRRLAPTCVTREGLFCVLDIDRRVKVCPSVITRFLSRFLKLNWVGLLDTERNWNVCWVRTPATCYKATERAIFSIPCTRPEGVEISNMLDVSMRRGWKFEMVGYGGMCMKVPVRKGFWGVVVFFEDRKEICEIVLFISPHFCLCLSVCLSVLSRWKQLDRYVSTIPAAVPGEQSTQPRCKTKTH
jgi:hypothetical protein